MVTLEGTNIPPQVTDFCTAGHQAVDWIASELLSAARTGQRVHHGPPYTMAPAPPESGCDYTELLNDFASNIFPGLNTLTSGRYMAYFSSSASEPSIIGSLLTAAVNSNAMLSASSPSGVELEEGVGRWVCAMVGLPDHFHSLSTEGGSTSNHHALAAARHRFYGAPVKTAGLFGYRRGRIYCSEEGHSSIAKAAVALGLGMDAVTRIRTDADLRMDCGALERAIRGDLRKGIKPIAIVATIGTTSTGAIDPVADIVPVCRQFDTWLHIDASYGGAAGVVPELRRHFVGWEQADSVVINPHKWFFVPLEYSLLFVRDRSLLREAFLHVPDYLRSEDVGACVNPMDLGLTLGRSVRALRLWYVISILGVNHIREIIGRHLALAVAFAEWINQNTTFELLSYPALSVVTFRRRVAAASADIEDGFNKRLLAEINRRGHFLLSHTSVRGRFALRVALNNYYTSADDVRALCDELQAVSRALLVEEDLPRCASSTVTPHPDIGQ